MSGAGTGIDAPVETLAEVQTATEATRLERGLGIPGVGPRLLSADEQAGMGRFSLAALARAARRAR